MAYKMPTKYKRRYEKVFSLTQNGEMSVTEAGKKVGLTNLSSYYQWLKREHPARVRVYNSAKRASPTKGTRLVSLPEASIPGSSGKIILLMGNAHDVINAAKGLF